MEIATGILGFMNTTRTVGGFVRLPMCLSYRDIDTNMSAMIRAHDVFQVKG